MTSRPRRNRVFSVLAAAVAAGTAITGFVISGSPGKASAATTSSNIYVDNTQGYCFGVVASTDPGNGTEAKPFCTISAAAAAAQPGQTVFVYQTGRAGTGVYPAQTISVSGTASEPITFVGEEDSGFDTDIPDLLISGAHHVVISGFTTGYAEVSGSSSDITLNGDSTGFSSDFPSNILAQHPGVLIDSGASDVTVSRGSLLSSDGTAAVQVTSGASGVVITGNTLDVLSDAQPGIVVNAPGTDVTGNTVTACGQGISVAGGAGGASIENNIVETGRSSAGTCTTTGDTTAISVAGDSTSGTTADYNLIYPPAGDPLYNWGGTPYASLAAFQGGTGQGAHDIAANPDLGDPRGQEIPGVGSVYYYPPAAGTASDHYADASPAIDSANADAPGELPTDQFANPRTDDPNVPNTGTGSGAGTSTGYFDRGAVEVQGPVSLGGATLVTSGPLTITATPRATASWVTNGPIGELQLSLDTPNPTFVGQNPYPVVTSSAPVQFTFTTTGAQTVKEYQTYGNPSGTSYTRTVTAVVGADYTPVAPTRILDTRNGTGAVKGAVKAYGTLFLPIPTTDGVSAFDMSAVVMNVTATDPTAGGHLTVFPFGGSTPTASNLNFARGATVPNLVTVGVFNGRVSIHNSSAGTVQVVADLEGFYGPGGYGFQPKPPARVLDTRNGTGAARQPLAAGGRIRLNLAGKVPAGTKAVVVNLTATGPQRAGYLTAYPDAATRPTASNLNFTAGETRANLVIAALNNGILDISNTSGGTVQVVADLEGYFAAGAPDSFVPVAPIRLVDTRNGVGGSALKPGATINIKALSDSCTASCPQPVAMAANMTVTGPTRAGFLTVYPYRASRPNASNVNFTAGETIANLAMTQATSGTVTAYNASGGTTQLVVDEYGYFIAPAG